MQHSFFFFFIAILILNEWGVTVLLLEGGVCTEIIWNFSAWDIYL